jgi:hypothetical protein
MSAWTDLQNWLTDCNLNSKLNPEVLKVVNIRSTLLMFCYLDELTIYLNKYFNTFESLKLDQEHMLSFLKRICLKRNIKKYQFSFVKQEKKDNIINRVQMYIPYLKKEEVKYFLNQIKNTEYEDQLLESFGLQQTKKKRLNKNELKKINQVISENKKDSGKIVTWDQWVNHF